MSKMFKVEVGVPLPTNDRRSTKYPFETLSIGESFFVPDDFGISHNAVRQAVKEANNRYPGHKFVSRRIDRPGARSGTRVWRVEMTFKSRGRGTPTFTEGVGDGENGGNR